MSKELLKCFNNIFFVFRENLVNKELLVLLATVDLLDLWDPLDLLDLLERLEERSELHNNNNKRLQITMSGHQFYGCRSRQHIYNCRNYTMTTFTI